MIDENGAFTDEFRSALPEMLGDDYFNDPETKQQPTKMFENVKDMKSLVKFAATAQRKVSAGDKRFEEQLEGMVKLPGKNATPEETAAFNKLTGAPDSKDGYELTIPENDDKTTYEAIAGVVRAAAHEAGISAKKLPGVWNKVVEALVAQNKAIEEKGLALIKADEDALKEKYPGDKHDALIKTGDKALGTFKAGKAVTELLTNYGIINHPAIREFLANEVAPLVLEGVTAGGDSVAGADGEKWPVKYKYDDAGKPVE